MTVSVIFSKKNILSWWMSNSEVARAFISPRCDSGLNSVGGVPPYQCSHLDSWCCYSSQVSIIQGICSDFSYSRRFMVKGFCGEADYRIQGSLIYWGETFLRTWSLIHWCLCEISWSVKFFNYVISTSY
jgi:hypothetical protein